MTETLCAAADVQLKAGSDYPTGLSAGNFTTLINLAEGVIAGETRYDWVTNYSSISDRGKEILKDAASSHAAMAAINYKLTNYDTLAVAQTMLDVNLTIYNAAIKLLNDAKVRTFIGV